MPLRYGATRLWSCLRAPAKVLRPFPLLPYGMPGAEGELVAPLINASNHTHQRFSYEVELEDHPPLTTLVVPPLTVGEACSTAALSYGRA